MEMLKLQSLAKKEMTARSFLAGYKLGVGD